jgi:hypothetical protein
MDKLNVLMDDQIQTLLRDPSNAFRNMRAGKIESLNAGQIFGKAYRSPTATSSSAPTNTIQPSQTSQSAFGVDQPTQQTSAFQNASTSSFSFVQNKSTPGFQNQSSSSSSFSFVTKPQSVSIENLQPYTHIISPQLLSLSQKFQVSLTLEGSLSVEELMQYHAPSFVAGEVGIPEIPPPLELR